VIVEACFCCARGRRRRRRANERKGGDTGRRAISIRNRAEKRERMSGDNRSDTMALQMKHARALVLQSAGPCQHLVKYHSRGAAQKPCQPPTFVHLRECVCWANGEDSSSPSLWKWSLSHRWGSPTQKAPDTQKQCHPFNPLNSKL
jgi:hypothetical protein